MNMKFIRHLSIDFVERLTKLNRPMASTELANDNACLGIQRPKQRLGANARECRKFAAQPAQFASEDRLGSV